MPLPPKAELQWWYQYYFATERGRAGYEEIPARFRQADLATRLAEVEFRRCDVRPLGCVFQQSGPRRHRDSQLPLAARAGQGRAEIRRTRNAAAEAPIISVPTITMEGDANGAPHPPPGAYAKKFSGKYQHRNITAASGITCRRKRRKHLPMRLSTSLKGDCGINEPSPTRFGLRSGPKGMPPIGPKLPTRNVRYSVAMGGKADVTRAPLNGRS